LHCQIAFVSYDIFSCKRSLSVVNLRTDFFVRWLRGVAEPGAFYYPRSSLRFILRVCRPDSGILWILRGEDTGDTLSVVAFELTVYSIESDLHSAVAALFYSTICMTKITKIDSIFSVLNDNAIALFTLGFYKF